jgi:multidrug efflux pump subunit AcrB
MVCDRIADILRSQESIVNAVVFCGGTAPNFYYNVLPRAPAANLAQVLINTREAEDVPGLVVKLRAELDREIFHASCIVRQLDQGPALEAPIMIRLTGNDLGVLRKEADAVSQVLRDSGGYKVSDDLGEPVPAEKMVEAGELPEYAVISHTAGKRAVTVKACSVFDQLPSRVLKRARETIDIMALPPGYALEYAGEERELKNSRREMQRVMKISLALIALAMVIQFKSIMKSLVVMLTVPLGLAGAFIGLAATHASFGFMALLGLVSLAGVIVSHIIVLSDFIEEARASGMELKEALLQAGLVRLRAVLVTVLATVCGLVPLALQGGALWRPLTAVHIFGLLLATALTLLVLPVWYYLFAARLRWI